MGRITFLKLGLRWEKFVQEYSCEMYLGSGLDFDGLWPLVEAHSVYSLEIYDLVLG